MRSRIPDSGSADPAAASVIGTLLMALITVAMALALSDFVAESVPDPATETSRDLQASLGAGLGGWGDGDETVTLIHRGGPRLERNATLIEVSVEDDEQTHTGSTLDDGFADGELTIGERWTSNRTVPPDASVTITVVDEQPRPHVVADIQLRAGSRDCSNDTDPPTVESIDQDPTDVDASHLGDVRITATLVDDCAGLDATDPPHLLHGTLSDTSLDDAGAMTHEGGTSWTGSIPEPTNGWDALENETLVYRLEPLSDAAGNEGASDNYTDLIQPGEAVEGTLTYATDFTIENGTVVNFTNLQDASDGGLTANLTENATGSGTVLSEIYGTAHSSQGATAPGNATGAPDDGHAVLPSDSDWVGVTGFNTFEGNIETVEIALEGHADGTANGAEDELRLSYEVSGDEGATSTSFAVSDLGDGSDGPAEYVNVTADRAWTWSDIGNLLVRAEYTKNQAEDDVDFHVDALWTRVRYADPAYNLSVQMDVTDVPNGTHELELRYNTTGEAFHLSVFNHTSQAWTRQGSALTATDLQNWTVPLEAAHESNGTVQLRFNDDTSDAVLADTLALDYVRVRTR